MAHWAGCLLRRQWQLRVQSRLGGASCRYRHFRSAPIATENGDLLKPTRATNRAVRINPPKIAAANVCKIEAFVELERVCKKGGRSIATVESPHLLRLVCRCRRVCRYVCRIRQRLHVQRLHRIVAAGFRRLARVGFAGLLGGRVLVFRPWASSADRWPTALAPGF
jgi:hypothetical protein